VAQLQADRRRRVVAAELQVPRAAGRESEPLAMLGLLELVAVDRGRIEIDRVLEEEREVREQVELRADGER